MLLFMLCISDTRSLDNDSLISLSKSSTLAILLQKILPDSTGQGMRILACMSSNPTQRAESGDTIQVLHPGEILPANHAEQNHKTCMVSPMARVHGRPPCL